MVLESLATEETKESPAYLIIVSCAITIAGVIMAYNTFPQSSSVLAISFTTLALMPFINNLFKKEETKISTEQTPKRLITENFQVISVYSSIFIGMALAYVIMGVFFPETNENCEGISCMMPEKKSFFSEQRTVYSSITGKVIAEKECFNNDTKNFGACFELIFKNNTWVMVMALIFSIVWGAGALFLLGWNASVIGLFIAMEISAKNIEAGITRAISYLPHGIPEITAYFIAAIAGGIISAAISKNKFKPNEIKTIIIDAGILIAMATTTLTIGALIETAAIFGSFEISLGGVILFMILYSATYITVTK